MSHWRAKQVGRKTWQSGVRKFKIGHWWREAKIETSLFCAGHSFLPLQHNGMICLQNCHRKSGNPIATKPLLLLLLFPLSLGQCPAKWHMLKKSLAVTLIANLQNQRDCWAKQRVHSSFLFDPLQIQMIQDKRTKTSLRKIKSWRTFLYCKGAALKTMVKSFTNTKSAGKKCGWPKHSASCLSTWSK